MRRMPIPDRRIFHLKDMHPPGIWGIRPSFPGLSPCPGQVAYVLLTSAPVAAKGIATSALPLDLHVLSLSLAFILSQDQTLRCCILSFSLSRIKMKTQHLTEVCSSDSWWFLLYCVLCFRINGNIKFPFLLYYVISLQTCQRTLFLSHFHAPFEAKSGAKLQPFLILTKFFWNFFHSKLLTGGHFCC